MKPNLRTNFGVPAGNRSSPGHRDGLGPAPEHPGKNHRFVRVSLSRGPASSSKRTTNGTLRQSRRNVRTQRRKGCDLANYDARLQNGGKGRHHGDLLSDHARRRFETRGRGGRGRLRRRKEKKRPHWFGGVRQNGGARQPLLHFGRRPASGPGRRSSGAEHLAGSGCGSDHPYPRQQLARRFQHSACRSQRLPDGRCGQPLADQRLGHRVDRDSEGRFGIGNLRIAGCQRRDPRHDQVGRERETNDFGQAPDGHQPPLRPASTSGTTRCSWLRSPTRSR